MQLTVSKKALLPIATRMASVAQAKSTMPMLANILINATDAGIVLVATDLYLSLRGTIPADVKTPGSVAVSAKDFVERIKTMPDGEVIITTNESALTLKAKGSARKFTMRVADANDFPPLPRPDAGAPTMTLDVSAIGRLLKLTEYAVSSDDTRAHLASLDIEFDGDVLRSVSTDGHRLALAEAKLEGRSASTTMLWPRAALKEIRTIADEIYSKNETDQRPEMTIVHSGPYVFFQGGAVELSAKLIDATFPPWRQVLPSGDRAKVARFARGPMLDALKAVSVAANDKLGVKLSFTTGRIMLASSSPDGGDGVDEIPADYSGPNMSIGVNAKYLMDSLAALSTDEASFGLDGELDPILVRPVGDTSGEARAVVMPMRLS